MLKETTQPGWLTWLETMSVTRTHLSTTQKSYRTSLATFTHPPTWWLLTLYSLLELLATPLPNSQFASYFTKKIENTGISSFFYWQIYEFYTSIFCSVCSVKWTKPQAPTQPNVNPPVHSMPAPLPYLLIIYVFPLLDHYFQEPKLCKVSLL